MASTESWIGKVTATATASIVAAVSIYYLTNQDKPPSLMHPPSNSVDTVVVVTSSTPDYYYDSPVVTYTEPAVYLPEPEVLFAPSIEGSWYALNGFNYWVTADGYGGFTFSESDAWGTITATGSIVANGNSLSLSYVTNLGTYAVASAVLFSDGIIDLYFVDAYGNSTSSRLFRR